MKQQIKLKLLEQFSCLGADCPASCCAFFDELPVSEQDMDTWRHVQDAEERKSLLGSVREKIKDGVRVYELRQYADHRCVHFGEDHLCRIQMRHGHEFLPTTCRNYPRTMVDGESSQVHTARLSCPQVVRLLLAGEPGAEFSTEPVEQSDDAAAQRPDFDILAVAEVLTTLVERVFKAPEVSLDARIYYIAEVLGQVTLQAMDETLDERSLGKLCGRTQETVNKRLSDTARQISGGKISVNKERAGRFWQLVYQQSVLQHDAEILPAIEGLPVVAALANTESGEPAAKQKLVKIYNEISKLRKNAQQKYPDEMLPLMTSYLRVTFMNQGFPWNPVLGNFNATFLKCVMPFARVQLSLWMLAASRDQLHMEDAERLIYAVERYMAHTYHTYDFLGSHPEYLQLDRYTTCFIGIV